MSASSRRPSGLPPGLNPPPQIMTQPADPLEVEPGRSSSLSVQAIGRGLRYQWCKRAEDDVMSPETAQQRVFREHVGRFKQCVDAANLNPHLLTNHLITSEQAEELMHEVVGNTNARKVKRLLQWLPKSSANFVDKLIDCLRETDHSGHLELADDLERELWVPLSTHHCRYDGVNNSTLILCTVMKAHEGVYRCRVTSNDGSSILSEAAHVSLIKANDKAVQAFVADLQATPDKGAELAQTLISKLQTGSSVGYVALTDAIKTCGDCKEVVRAFVANGWSADEQWQDGKTLVHVLAEQGCTDSLSLVLRAGCSEGIGKVADKDRCTPLHLAVRMGRLGAVQTLLDVEGPRKSINYQDKDFNTALHLAVESGSVDMVQALIAVPGISLEVLNENNQTALELAKQKGQHRIITILKEKESSAQMVLSPLANRLGSALLGEARRSNSCDCLHRTADDSALHRTASQMSHATSGYSSNTGSRDGSMPRSESALLMTPDRRVLEVQRQLVNYRGTLTGKKLLKRGVLKKCNRKGMLQDCTLFLFTDVMLYTKYNDIFRKYTVIEELSVRGMEVLDPDPPAVRNEPLSFTVTSKERALKLVASTDEEKEEWIQCLKDTIAALLAAQPSQLPDGAGLGARAPVWVPDTHVTACQLCNKRFSFIDRKHHCRQCGKVVCGVCSPEKRYLTYMQKEGRICSECVEAFAGRKSVDSDSRPNLERSAGTVISGYATRLGHGVKGETKWYRLDGDNVIYVYGAHQDTMPSHRIILKMGYSLHADMGSRTIMLTHPQGREELNEAFQVPVNEYSKWYDALKERTRTQ